MQQSQQLNKTERQCLSTEKTHTRTQKTCEHKVRTHTRTHGEVHANVMHAKTHKL